MQLVSDKKMCAICNRPLKWWNLQSCVDCGKVVCGHHAHAVRCRHSSVLRSYCAHCIEARSSTTTQPLVHERQRQLVK